MFEWINRSRQYAGWVFFRFHFLILFRIFLIWCNWFLWALYRFIPYQQLKNWPMNKLLNSHRPKINLEELTYKSLIFLTTIFHNATSIRLSGKFDRNVIELVISVPKIWTIPKSTSLESVTILFYYQGIGKVEINMKIIKIILYPKWVILKQQYTHKHAQKISAFVVLT